MGIKKITKKLSKWQKKQKKLKQTTFESVIFIIFMILNLTLMFCNMGILLVGTKASSNIDVHPSSIYSLNVVYENMTADEIAVLSKIVSQIRSEYLYNQEEIVFVRNIPDSECENCAGYNYNHGKTIVVQNMDDPQMTKYVLCHELLHTYVNFLDNSDDQEEDVVGDLGMYMPCYTDSDKYAVWEKATEEISNETLAGGGAALE